MDSSGKGTILTSPLVSIITPTYNRAAYLDETIQSVLKQDYSRIEYIVLDDGSSDRTVQLLEKYTGKLIWETHSNMGEARTVNKGWRMAHGEIVAVLNSDDPLLPGAVSSAVAYMELNNDILVAYPDWDVIGPDSKVMKHVQVPEYNYLDMVRYHRCSVGPGAFIRHRALDLAGMRDPDFKYVTDLEYWLRLGLYGKFARIPKTLATWREHPDAASQSCKSAAMADEHIRMIEKYYSRDNLPPEVLAIKGEALCWSHGVAALTCGSGPLTSLKYFRRAFQIDPVSFFKAMGRGYAWRTAALSLIVKPMSGIFRKIK